MSTVQKLLNISISDYLDGELKSDVRHEYINGNIFAMVGASAIHNVVNGTLFSLLHSHIKDSPCTIFQTDMKVRVDHAFYYPDCVVTCEPIKKDSYFITEPKIIIEVLSESTEGRDKLEKRLAYQSLPSLIEYCLVSQNKMDIEIYRRTKSGWEIEEFLDNDVVHFRSVEFRIPIKDIYRDAMRMV